MPRIEIYTKRWCAFCQMAKALLERTGLRFEEHDVTSDPHREQEMRDRSGQRSVPQILIDGQPVGGYSELRAMHAAGKLEKPGDPEGAGGERP